MTTHLEVHSSCSMGQGTAWPRQLVARAVEYGMGALALTDTDGMCGAIPFYAAARAAGIKPILGARPGRCVLLARDREGYAHVCEIVSVVRLGAVAAERLDAWPFPFGAAHVFVLSDDRSLLLRLHRQGIPALAAVAHYGGAASQRRAETDPPPFVPHTQHQRIFPTPQPSLNFPRRSPSLPTANSLIPISHRHLPGSAS